MYGIFTYIYHKFHPNVSIDTTIHGDRERLGTHGKTPPIGTLQRPDPLSMIRTVSSRSQDFQLSQDIKMVATLDIQTPPGEFFFLCMFLGCKYRTSGGVWISRATCYGISANSLYLHCKFIYHLSVPVSYNLSWVHEISGKMTVIPKTWMIRVPGGILTKPPPCKSWPKGKQGCDVFVEVLFIESFIILAKL